MLGTITGPTTSSSKTGLPGSRPRTSASETSVPTTVATIDVSTAMRRLNKVASSQSWSQK